jgi:hypothetical protein
MGSSGSRFEDILDQKRAREKPRAANRQEAEPA